MHKVLHSYLRRLTNLSSNNRSLFLPRLLSHQYIDLHAFDFVNNYPSFKIIEWLIAGGEAEGLPTGTLPLCPLIDSRDDASNQLSVQLKKLHRTEKFLFEEQGSKDLYIGWPFVRGKFMDGTLVRCPLLFFPVSLEVTQDKTFAQHWEISLRDDITLSFNKSFLLAYSYYNQMGIDQEFLERSFDDFETDSRIFRTSLYKLFKESPFEINFNQDNFVDKFTSFKEFTKAALEKTEKNGELKLYPEAVLGIFPQSGSYIVPDYLALIENNFVQDIESFFNSKARAGESDNGDPQSNHAIYRTNYDFRNRIKEEQIYAPYKMDAYQENALKAIKKGNSMVVQGPPGTGKSQLITNLIADFIGRGKRVLLVSQKKAALDVVYQRLQAKDINPFVALVHDFRNDRKRIYGQIRHQIEALDEYKLKNNSLDAIYLERNFLQLSRRIEQITEELEEFKSALYDESEAGVSVKELYLTSDIHHPVINVKQEYKFFNVQHLQGFIHKLRTYTSYASSFERENYPWRDRKSFKDYSVKDLKSIKEMLQEIPSFKEKIVAAAQKVLHAPVDFATCEVMQTRSEKILEVIKTVGDPVVYSYFQHMVQAEELVSDPLWLSNTERVLMECFRGNGPETSLKTSELGKFQESLERAKEARSSLFSWIWWRLSSDDKKLVNKVFASNHLKPNRKGFKILVEKVDNRLNLEHNLTKLREKQWIKDVPAKDTEEIYDKAYLQTWFFQQKQALHATWIFHSLRNFKQYFNVKLITYDELKERGQQLLDTLSEIPTIRSQWFLYLVPPQVARVINDDTYIHFLLDTLHSDFDALCEFDKLRDDLEPHEKIVIDKLMDEAEEIEGNFIEQLFQHSLRLAWIDHIETKYPVLRAVSSGRLQTLEKELQECVIEKFNISNEILLMKTREQTYKNLEYNRLNNMVTYRELLHQVTKKRKIWPVRKLFTTFHNELFNLVPCWMASPESVSTIFPMSASPIFDLVIFDEASQCFAEKGIPAMYRGQQVVIVGDDKQLKPNDLYQARWDEDTDDSDPAEAMALEADSLLSLAKQFLMQVQLKDHYRSKTLELIDFSNRNFYENYLRLLPDFQDMNAEDASIKYLKVEGIWKNQTNEAEARKVVELVGKLVSEMPDKEIGIITFNIKQRELIQDLLEENAVQSQSTIPDTLFVKNIENVQGDEKDIIIFSTAYAPDEKGKLHLQFGSLNVVHGENRLNVAITRARERIYIISSILPHQLDVSKTKNEGPKLLKAYLEYAWEVSEGKYQPTPYDTSQHRIDWFLQNKLQQWGKMSLKKVKIAPALPFTDLTLSVTGKQSGYLGLIRTDDELYYQSVSAKEMHVYLPFIMESKNWKHKFIYSREYWQDPEKVQEDLLRFVNMATNG